MIMNKKNMLSLMIVSLLSITLGMSALPAVVRDTNGNRYFIEVTSGENTWGQLKNMYANQAGISNDARQNLVMFFIGDPMEDNDVIPHQIWETAFVSVVPRVLLDA